MGKLYSLISALLLAVGMAFAAAPSEYEWWFDKDLSTLQSGTISGSTVDFDVDTSTLPKGIHYFNYRMATDEGVYGAVYRKVFHSLGTDRGAISYEYWFDEDYDAKVAGDISVGNNVFELDITSLPKGAHFFNCRLGYGGDDWGAVYRKMILNLSGTIDAVGFEYWLNDKYASKTEGDFSDGINTYEIDLKGVRRGLHRFNYRIRTGDGTWGAVYTNYFFMASNPEKFTAYEYWFDDDYENRVSANVSGNPATFEVDLSNFDKSGGAHYFNLRTRDGDGEWNPIYHKLLVFNKDEKRIPIIGYRHYANGIDLGYVEVARELTDSYLFDISLPDSLRPSVKDISPSFEGDKVSLAAADSLVYVMHTRTEFGWGAPQQWKLPTTNPFSISAVAVAVNSKQTFSVPDFDKIVAVKFTATGDSLYFRSDIPIALDIYKDGNKVEEIPASELAAMTALKLEAGAYFGILRNAEKVSDSGQFTFHLMDTPNAAPMPKISYEEGMVTISCSRSDAKIFYTLDKTEPSLERTPYGEPFQLLHNAVIKARAYVPDSDIEPSSVAEFVIDSYKVAQPTGEFNRKEKTLTIKCETEGAAIRYRYNAEQEWLAYEAPLKIRRNGSVFAKASLPDYNDSDVEEIKITQLPDSIPAPKVEFAEGKISMSSTIEDAVIRYVIGDSIPNVGSTLYEAPFPLAHNAVVRAIAYIPETDIDPSRVTECVVDTYKVATPECKYDFPSRKLNITCATAGAAISYRIGDAGDWTEFKTPIRIARNCTIYAIATLKDFNDSDEKEIVISEFPDVMPNPEIAFEDGKVSISSEREDAKFRYTLDKTDPTMESTLYNGAFELTHNAVVKAIAYIEDCDVAPSEVTTFDVNTFKVKTPTGSFDMPTRTMTLSCATSGAKISYRIGAVGEWMEYTVPFTIGRNTTVYAKATLAGYNDSEVAEFPITGFPDSMPKPAISFKNGMVSMSCERKDAEIRYTLDKTVPTMKSTLYEGEFALSHNATIWAIAYIPKSDIEPSEVAEYIVDTYKVATPEGHYDFPSRMLNITCATAGAAISYRIGETGDWTEFKTPIRIARNCTVYAKATLKDFNYSDEKEIVISDFPDVMPKPEISFEDGKVTISSERKDAKFRYTLDKSDPTMQSTLYNGPFALTHNAVVKAIAYIDDCDVAPSEVATYEVSTFKVAMPTGSFDMPTRTMTLSCATSGAKISYRIGAAGEWQEYSEPFTIGRNTTVYAKAILEGYNDSEVAEFPITGFPDSMPKPAISFKNGMVSMNCERADAEIRYTLDKTVPTMKSTLYEKEFALTHNATIRAIAYIPNSDIEPSEMAEYVVDSYKVEMPTGSFDMPSRTMTLSCATSGANISYRIGAVGEWQEYTKPFTIGRNTTVYAKATLEGYNDSEVAEFPITGFPDSMPMPVISFKDGMVSMSCERKDAEIRYTLDKTVPTMKSTLYEGEFALSHNATIWAIAYIPNSDIEPSEVAQYIVNTYQVATPEGKYDFPSRMLNITCATTGAAISYRIGELGEWTEFKTPIRIARNSIVYAKATFKDFNDSEVKEIGISDFPDVMPKPEISFEDGKVTISNKRDDAKFRYTLDKTVPTMQSTLYNGPFALTHNAVIKAIAYIDDCDVAPSEVTTFEVKSFQVKTPTGSFDMPSRTMTLSCDTKDAKISYRIGAAGEWQEYSVPFTIGRNTTVYAKATLEGYNDSEVAEFPITGFPDSMPKPAISFKNGMVSMSCERADAEIRYTLDKTVPTMKSTLYEGEFALSHNATIRAIAYIPNSDIEPSEMAELVVNSYKVATPEGKYDFPSRMLSITCSTTGAAISYRIGESGEWAEFNTPIRIARNCTVYAKATFKDFNDSEVKEIVISDFPDVMPKPEISFKDGKVTISSERKDAKFRYTLDKTDPTMESTLYNGAFELTHNAVVKAIAYIEDCDVAPSEVANFEVKTFQVKTPNGSFDMPSRTMTLSCATSGAKISYRIGAVGEWQEYSEPFTIGRNTTVYAKATLEGYNDSAVAEFTITGFPDSMPQPVISFKDGMVSMSCERADAEIRYTLDKTVPTMKSTLYEGEFALSHNATIWAIAYIPNSDIEPSEVAEYIVNTYQVATPTGKYDSATGSLTLYCETTGASIRYTFDPDGEWMPYTQPITITSNCKVYAKATAEGYNESEMYVIEISEFKCNPISISYDGRYVTLSTNSEAADEFEIRYAFGDADPAQGEVYSGKFDAMGLCTVKAIAMKPGYQNSEIAERKLEGYADKNHAETSVGGILESCFEWSGSELPESMEEFRVEGVLNDADFAFLKTMKSLRHLDIENVKDARIPDYAFQNTGLISISLPADLKEYGVDILSGCDRLCGIIWNSTSIDIDARLTNGLTNPNLLLYVPSEVNVENAGNMNIIIDDVAPSIILHDEYPFAVAREFEAKQISFTRNFDMETPLDNGCAGWESIILPFTPDSIMHERAGKIVTFDAWEEEEYADFKPFWLYRSNEYGWEAVKEMEGGVPYIISMPNNPAYIHDFNIVGNVSFVASNVTLTPASASPEETPWVEGTELVGTFMPVEEPGVRSLNIFGEDDRTPGSAFVAQATTKPFGAFVRGTKKQYMPVFGDWTSVLLPTVGTEPLRVESPAPGMLKITSNCRRKVALMTMTGVTLRTISLSPGETVTIEGLTRDIYIVGGMKVTVR